jgi:FADH2 O2-dependent halogenase
VSARLDADVAVLGAGFSGALTALALRRAGHSVVLIERGRHPRFAIGESSTPLANLLLEELSVAYDLPRLAPLAQWGTWRRAYPSLPVGLKRGFSFFQHAFGEPFADDASHARQLLVAASPHDEVADTHWYRPAFDAFLAGEAVDAGVELLDDTDVRGLQFLGDLARVDLVRRGASRSLRVDFVVDATGPRGALHRLLRLEEAPPRWLPPTEGVYAHFEGVARWDEVVRRDAGVPYPVDDAALHQIFPGGWIWILRFDNGITSAGAAITAPLASALQLGTGEHAWERLIERLPSVRRQFADAHATMPFVSTPRLAFRSRVVHGERWALLPSAAGVIDPLLSTGFPLTLLGITRLLRVITGMRPGAERSSALDEYAAQIQRELDATERLVAALYATMADFGLFKRLARLYFAASSFSEMARRLGRPELAPGFLLCDHPAFGSSLRAICEVALMRPTDRARANLFEQIDRVVEPFDVAGLSDQQRRDWHDVRVDDLLTARAKLGATDQAIWAVLERCGFAGHSAAARQVHDR